MAGAPVPSVRGHHKHAQVDAVGLGLIMSKVRRQSFAITPCCDYIMHAALQHIYFSVASCEFVTNT